MKYPVFDKDLTPLLRECDNAELDPIVSLILAAPTQTLTLKEEYRAHAGDHKAYIDEIVYEVTSFGGNALSNLLRGHGVPYAEMVGDVAAMLGARPTPLDTVATLEEKIILKIIRLAYAAMSPEDQAALRALLQLDDEIDLATFPEERIGGEIVDTATSLAGDRIQHAVLTAARSTRIRQAFMTALRSGIVKLTTASLGGPVSWITAAGQAIFDLAGPNYTTVLGLIAQIGILRQKHDRIPEEQDLEAIELEMK
jgi:uncharacterized protein YaaW (UPF0174 family)